MRFSAKSSLLLCVSLMLAAPRCITVYKVQVTGYLDAERSSSLTPGASFFLVQNQEANNPLLEKEVASKIARLLENKGYHIAPDEEADFRLSFAYGMDTGRMEVVPWEKRDTITTTNPITGVTSKKDVVTDSGTHSVQYYMRSLSIRVLDARRLRESQKAEVVWAGDTVSEGSSLDLRQVLDYLLVGTFEYFGQDTGKAVRVEMMEGDARVRSLAASQGALPSEEKSQRTQKKPERNPWHPQAQ